MNRLYLWSARVVAVVFTFFSVGFALVSNAPTVQAQAQVNSQWVHNFASSQDIEITSMSLSAIGEIFIAGIFHGTVDFDPGAGETLLSSGARDTSFIAKYDPTGNLVWAYRLIGESDVRIYDIVVDPMAQIGVIGSFKESVDLDPGPGFFNATSNGGHDIFVLRLLPDGNLQWAWTAGDDGDDIGFAVTTDSRSGLYVTGRFEGKIFFESGGSPSFEHESIGGTDAFAVRFSNSGRLFWVRVWGGNEDDAGLDIELDGKGTSYIAGTFEGEVDLDPQWTATEVQSRGRSDIFVIALNELGNFHWSTHLGGPGTDNNPQVLVEEDSSLYVGGQFERTGDFDLASEGGLIESRGGLDIFVARFGIATGHHFQWAYSIGGAQNETLAGLAQDGFGNFYVLGDFGGTVDFDMRDGVTELTSGGGRDSFLAKYGREGDFRRAQAIAGPQDDRALAIAINSNDNVLVGGEYSSTLDLGSGLTTSTGQAEGIYNAFVAHYARDSWTPLPLRSFLPGIIANPSTE